MPTQLTADRVLRHMRQPAYSPVKPKRLLRQLGLSEREYPRLRALVKQMLDQGRILKGHGGVLTVPGTGKTVVGVFRGNEAGFGFVRPMPPGEDPDIYIRPDDRMDAATGDRVAVEIIHGGRGRRGPRGRLVEIQERASRHFVGTYFERGGKGYVEPDGDAILEDIAVGDPGAKGARPRDKVVFEMLRFPSARRPGEGVLTEVLGQRGAPGVDTLAVMRQFSLPDAFPEPVQDAARAAAKRFDESDVAGREDFTAPTTVTIDPPDARDFDDAITLQKCPDGGWVLGVHIADVSHFVTPGSALDDDARERATSIYLPTRVIPMLPELISNGLASLQEGHNRYTLSCVMTFDARARRSSSRLASSVIRVDKRLTYEQVSDALLRGKGPRMPAEVKTLLADMRELALLLKERRRVRGALELALPEVDLEFDADGNVVGAKVTPHDISHQIIEEFMLAANEAVADYLHRLSVPFLRRIHPAPNNKNIYAFAAFARSCGLKITRPGDRHQLQKLLSQVHDRPEAPAINYALLRAMRQAEYSPEAEEHYALASPCYCHFTSPIRRYPDLTVHRLVTASLGRRRRGRKRVEPPPDLVELGRHCSDMERRAEQAERELTKVKLLVLLKEHLGDELEGLITGVEEFGLFVQSKKFLIDGLVHVSRLPADEYQLSRTTMALTGTRRKRQFRLGDSVQVRVVRVDVSRRQLDFELA